MKQPIQLERITYPATGIQWTCDNAEAICEFTGELISTECNGYLMLRNGWGLVFSMQPDSWMVRGADQQLRYYPQHKFEVMYREKSDNQ